MSESSKFQLEGEAHSQPTSAYIDEQIELGKSKQRVTIAILAVLALALLVWASISQYKLLAAKSTLSQTEKYREQAKAMAIEVNGTEQMRDSLENIIYKLKTENEILAENYETPQGVFFEIQLGNFKDFNIDKYNENLASPRQEKHDTKNKLLLARFRSFKKALLFENDLKRMGINNAFVVGRIDDKIVTYKEALDAIEEGNK